MTLEEMRHNKPNIRVTVLVALAGQSGQLIHSAAWVYLSTHSHLQINSMLMALLRSGRQLVNAKFWLCYKMKWLQESDVPVSR